MNTNTFPYYNDFIPNKKFYEILFKPGYSVQARELTQLQTMLQNQIKEFGDTVFKQGTVITGCAESHNFKTPYVKINDIDETTYPLSYYEGLTVTATNGVSAIIKKTAAGSEAEAPNLNTLYLHYTSNDTATNLISLFVAGDILTTSADNGIEFTVAAVAPTGEGSLFSLEDGIVYVNGRFLVHNHQTIVVDRYSTSPTQKVGYTLTEEIVTNFDDTTLNDPAQGSYNFNAPGADRFKISTVLESYSPSVPKPENFFLLFDIENGFIKRRYDKTQYSELSREFAHRTYDESGDYAVKQFPIVINEHLNNNTNHGKYTSGNGGDAGQLVVGVEPGKAYVRGFEQELYSTEFLNIDKAFTTNLLQNQNITALFGSYVLVNEVAGSWPINTDALVAIYETAAGAVTDNTFSGHGVGSLGATIGSARIRDLEWVSGTPGTAAALYKMYLTDVTLLTGKTFADIETFYLDDGASHFSFADASEASPVLNNTRFVAPIFPLTHKNVKGLSDSSYVFRKTFTNVAVAAGGSCAVTLPSGEEWAFSSVGTEDLIRNNIQVELVTPGSLGIAGQVLNIQVSPTGQYVTRTSAQVLTFALGANTGSPTVNVVVNVRKSSAACDEKTYRTHRYVVINTQSPSDPNGPYCLGLHDVVAIEGIWSAAYTEALPAADPLAGDATWTNVTADFNLDNGQTDTMYNLATIVKKATAASTTDKLLLVKLSYFEHASSGGFYSVDSYPLPASETETPLADQIYWHEIPNFTTSTGITYNLRDVLDFRPSVINTAANSTTIAGATTNPASTIAFGAGITTPTPNESFITDITYHLPRIDRVVLDVAGIFTTITGTPSENPVAPRQPDGAMTLALINIPAFPSLSPYFARLLEKPEYATTITFVDNRRYTMRDIGTIQRRVERLEKYASLSVLEQQAASMLIPDGSGIDRFKNGIIVDPFIGHNVGNVHNPDYACSIANGKLRPFFNIDNVTLEIDVASTGIARKADDISIVVRQILNGLVNFVAGEPVTSSSVGAGTGILRSASLVEQDTYYKWVRLYLENVTGVFAEDDVITGSDSGATGRISYYPLSGTTPAEVANWTAVLEDTYPTLVTAPTDGLLVTLPYTHVIYTESPYATKSRNCASQILFSFEGSMELSPSSDEWADSSVRPEILFNTDGISDNWLTMTTAWGTQWENWKTLWQKFDTSTEKPHDAIIDPSILTTSQRQLRDGISLSVQETENVNVIPYMRSVVVTFTASRMKANTVVYPFFDGVDVSAYCKPDASSTYGDALATDSTGTVVGQFRIPAETFMTGSKNFVLTDISTDPFSEDATTMAYASYTASGERSFDISSILSTQKPETTFDFQRTTQNSVIERQVTTGDSFAQTTDPIAQTFFVSNSDGGAVLTKIGVYFKTKSATSPITLQLRETRNGYPTESILPYSTITLDPRDVNVSEDGSSVTEFVFPSPVYLKNNTEYCFVLLPTGNDTGYNVWVGELGQMDIGTTNIIDKQPNAGTLFVSGNNRAWTPFINEDIKFVAFAGNFNGTGYLRVHNLPVEYMLFDTIVGTFYPGDEVASATGTGIIQFYDYQTNEAQVLVTVGSFLTTDSVASTSASATTTSIIKAVDALSPTLTFLDFNNTDLVWSYKIYDYDMTPFGSYVPLAVNGTTELSSPKGVFSYSDVPTPSLMLEGVLTTTAANISPIIDLEKLGCVIIGNAINNLTTNEALNELPSPWASALSRYISRTVILDDGQEADDLRVYLSTSIPSGASIAVYAKLLSPTDVVAFEDRPWTLMTETLLSGVGEFRERYYTLPATGHTTEQGGLTGGIFTYTVGGVIFPNIKAFAVKIVLLSDTTTNVPIVRDMRAIALQV